MATATAATAATPAVATTPAKPASGPAELRIAMGEWALVPERRAVRPGRVTLVITNRGKVEHGFELKAESGGGRHGGDGHGGDDRLELESRVLAPGETARIPVTLPAGVYEIECFVADHDDRGMHGLLEVRDDAPASSPRPRRVATGAVRIEGFAFQPRSLTVAAGKSVTWTNADAAAHTVTASAGGFSSDQLGRGQRFTRRFARAGRFAYICALHPEMRGVVTVR
jgi:plastocyanin